MCSNLTSITIPNSVTSIGVHAFYNCTNLTSIILPNSVSSIGDEAFNGCTGLTTITIPKRVKQIGSRIFLFCSALTELKVEEENPIYDSRENCNAVIKTNTNELFIGCNNTKIPNSVTDIGKYAFQGCNGIISIVLPNSVTSIGEGAFVACNGLTSVILSNNLKSIGEWAFNDCTSLSSVSIPNSVTSIGDYSFKGCSGLNSVNLSENLTSIGQSAFYGCSNLTSVTIPNSVTFIGTGAFNSCTKLTTLEIGSGIQQLEYHRTNSYTLGVFTGCPELKDVYCYAFNIPNTGEGNHFDGSYIEYATLHVPASAINAYNNTEPWSSFKEIVALDMQYYTLTYMVDGTKYKECWIEEGTKLTPEPAPTKEDYKFSGWSEIPETMPDHDVTVTGTFIENAYLPGDANGDGQITVTDIGVIVDIILGKTPTNARKQQEAEPQ